MLTHDVILNDDYSLVVWFLIYMFVAEIIVTLYNYSYSIEPNLLFVKDVDIETVCHGGKVMNKIS